MSTVSLFPNNNGKKDTVNAKQYQICRLRGKSQSRKLKSSLDRSISHTFKL